MRLIDHIYIAPYTTTDSDHKQGIQTMNRDERERERERERQRETERETERDRQRGRRIISTQIHTQSQAHKE